MGFGFMIWGSSHYKNNLSLLKSIQRPIGKRDNSIVRSKKPLRFKRATEEGMRKIKALVRAKERIDNIKVIMALSWPAVILFYWVYLTFFA